LAFGSPELTRDEYQDELMRPIYAALERGELRVFTPEEQSDARTWVARSPSA
jgi:hypothetical protein